MKKIITLVKHLVLLLALVSPLTSINANAQSQADIDKSEEIIDSIVSAPVKLEGEDKEYAHVWFSQIFGEFIFSPWDSKYENAESTIVSKTVGFTNILAMILGVVIVYYVLIGGALNTANQGEALGKQWSTMWIPIRAATGFFLITPITSVGAGVLSFAQIMIIWLIMMGSNAATVLWNSVVDELATGATVNKPIISVGIKPTIDIAKMLMCTEYYLRFSPSSDNRDYVGGRVVARASGGILTSSSFVYATVKDPNIGEYRIKGTSLSSIITDPKTTKVSFGPSGACGSLSFPIGETDDLATDYKILAMNDGLQTAKQKTAKVVDALIPIISDLTEYGTGPQAIIEALQSTDASPNKEIFNSATAKLQVISNNYSTTLIKDIHDSVMQNGSLNDLLNDKMKVGGWGKAGIWFYEIAAIPGLTYKVYNQVVSGISVGEVSMCAGISSWFNTDSCKQKNEEYSDAKLLITLMAKEIMAVNSGSSDPAIAESDNLITECTSGSTCKSGQDELTQIGSRWAKGILNIFAEGTSDNPVGSTSGLNSPFQVVSSIGHSMNQLAITLWWAGMAMSVAAGAVKGNIISSATGVGGAIAAGFQWITGTLVAAITPALGSGFVLAYVIPFMPIITWCMMMVGYLITVVEAVIAAPLAIILMVTPEGDGIAGTRLERAMQLLAMAILKPSLMIMGMVTAITVSAVGFSILNEFFFIAAEYQLYGSMIDFVPVILIYVSASLNMCKMLIGVMHNLPNQILDWFTSGTGRSFGEHESGEAAAHSMGDLKGAAGSMGGILGKTMTNAAQGKKNAKNKEYKNDKHNEMMTRLDGIAEKK